MFPRAYLRQPHEVSIETYAFCNARCTFCPYPTLERKGAKMSGGQVFALLEQMESWSAPFFISPFKVNEPLLDTRLSGICDHIIRCIPKATLRLFTNGSPLTSEHIDWISELPRGRVAHLWISLNESRPETYQQTMGLNFDITCRRLDHLHDVLAGGGFPHPVVISRVTDRERMDTPSVEDARFLSIIKQRWPRFRAQIIKRDAWIDFTTATDVGSVPHTPCGRWWELNVMADCRVALCCMDGTGKYAIGDVSQSSLLDIYNHPHLLARREQQLSRRGINPCERCTY